MNTRLCRQIRMRAGANARQLASRLSCGGELAGWIVPSATLALLPGSLAVLFCYLTVALSDLTANARESNPPAAKIRWGNGYLRQKPEWYASAEARVIANHVLLYQTSLGAWPKNTDLAVAPQSAAALAEARSGSLANTIDNGATTLPMRFLALMAQATGEEKYRAAFERGLDYLFAAQYASGGWPQFFPPRDHGYYSHITYNDDAMVNVLNVLRDAATGKPPYAFIDKKRRAKAAAAVARGVDCILKTQVKQNGNLTAWCAQHDEKTLQPAWARNYEPPTLSGCESTGILHFLMEIEQPMPEVIAAIEGAADWFKTAAIPGLRYERFLDAEGKRDCRVVADPAAGPLWARFYEIGSNRPVFAGRDKVIHYAFNEIEPERRAGYDYYGHWPAVLLAKDYPRWRVTHKRP